MASFADLAANLRLNISDFSSKLNSASAQARRFANDLSGKTGKALDEMNNKTTAWGLNLKSVSRVVSGILISQGFYKIMQSVRNATNAVWEFTKELETAHVAYSNLFGDIELAEEFINVLKDFAAKTPFSFTESEKAAKRLLAYGIEYKNVMYVMQGVLSAASIQGDSAKIESISRALGQIYTYGKLMTQEIRQLSEAGIPAYEILQEELGLTQEQLANLGNEGIKADVAINALVDGIQKRFGTAAEAAARTTSGIISNIKDNATMLFTTLFEPFTTFLKSGLAALGSFLFKLREIADTKGIGGVFEEIVPERLQGTLRQFLANLSALFQSVIRLAGAIGSLLKPVLEALVRVFNIFAPVLTTVINALTILTRWITENAVVMRILTSVLAAAAAMWVIYKTKAIAAAVVSAVITGISKALVAMSAVMTFVTAHPFWSLLIGVGGLLIGLSVGFDNLGNKVSSFFKKLTSFNGVDPDKVLLPSQEERADDLDKFNNKLEGTSDAMDDLADSTGKATKAAKGLLSFDEVFKLNDPDEGVDEGIVDELEDLLDGIGGLGDAYMPEIPDFSEYMDEFSNGFLGEYSQMWEGLKDAIANVAETVIGAAFGGLIGRLIGGKVGGAIGMLAGAIVGYFWDKLADYFGLTPDQRIDAAIVGGVGALIGAVLGGIVGGPLGAKIGAAIGGFVGSFWGLFAEYLGVVPEQHIATVISGGLTMALQTGLSFFSSLAKNLIPTYIDDVFVGFSRNVGFSIKAALSGALKQGVKGAIVSLGVGMLSNALTGWIAKEFDLTAQDLENSAVGQSVGNLVGSIIGLILGGPLGSLVGGALGQLGGAIIGEFWNYMNNEVRGMIIGGVGGGGLGALIGTIVGSIGGPVGAALGAGIGIALGGLIGHIVDNWEPIAQFFSDAASAIGDFFVGAAEVVSGAFTTIGGFLTGIKDSIVGVWNGISETVGPVVSDIGNAISTVWNDVSSAVSTVCSDIWNGVTTVWNDISLAMSTVGNDIWTGVQTVWNDISAAVTTVCTEVGAVVGEIWSFIRDLVVKVCTDIWNGVQEFFAPIVDVISTTCEAAWDAVSTFFTQIGEDIAYACSAAWDVVSDAFSQIGEIIADTCSEAWDVVSDAFTQIGEEVADVCSDVWDDVKKAFSAIYSSIKENVSAAYNAVKNGFSNIYNGIKDTISSAYTTVRDGIANIYNTFVGWIQDLWDNVFGRFFGWISDGIDALREFFGLKAEAESSSSYSTSGAGVGYGHATGGIFDREHVARFAEGNKAEAIIPLEEQSAMQPFVDAVANGLTASLAPIIANFNGSQQLQPLYVGTLIADEKSLRELERKMEIIRLQEKRR